MEQMIREVEQGRGFLLAGGPDSGKTSLMNEVALHFNQPGHKVVALGPLSLTLVSPHGLNSLGSQLRHWFRDNEGRLPFPLPSSYPTQTDSLAAWKLFLAGLISQQNANTLLILLDDLDSVPLELRETILSDINDSSWAKIAPRTVLGCAGNLVEDELSPVGGEGYHGNYASNELISPAVTKHCAVELLNALIINLGILPPGKKGKGKGIGDRKLSDGGKRSIEHAIKEDVDATVYAPFEAWPGKRFLVQVFAHRPKETAALEEIAKQAAPGAEKRVGATLSKQIERGSELSFNLIMKELEIDEPSQSCIWRGERELVQFEVTVPNDLKPVDVFGRVEVCQNSVPIGRLRFELKIVNEASSPGTENVRAGVLDRYKRAFISYSSKDRLEVFKRIQMLDALGPAYFMDQLNLGRGARWEKELYKYLDESDVVYLFWSKAASRSSWVTKEIEYARKRQAGNDEAPPAIVPIPLQGPREVKPPAKLSFLHFDDRFLYFIKAEEVLAEQSQRKRPKTKLKH
jgi:hypothetical protein